MNTHPLAPLLPESATFSPQGVLHLAGLPVPELAEEFGTPLSWNGAKRSKIYFEGTQFLTIEEAARHITIDACIDAVYRGAGLMRKLSEPPFEDFDEHNSPTEPMSAIILSPRVVPPREAGGGNGNGTGGYDAYTVPVPRPPEAPFPRNVPPAALPAYPAEMPGAYPVLPPLPVGHDKGRPPGGAGFLGERAKPVSAQPRYSSFPILVGMLFVLAQLVLLARVVLSLFGVPASNILVELVYGAGTVLAWPLRLLAGQLPLPAQMGGDLLNYLAALLAILVYGVLARILVRFLKALLNSR